MAVGSGIVLHAGRLLSSFPNRVTGIFMDMILLHFYAHRTIMLVIWNGDILMKQKIVSSILK
jgi:hypothetical protein